MGGMRKLRRGRRGKQYEVEPLRPQQSFHSGKMSQVILDFAEPLLNTIDDEVFEYAISFAVLCWNLSFLTEKEHQQHVRDILKGLGESDPMARFEVEDCIRMLLERKRFFFADEKRMVLSYQVVEEEDQHQHRLLVTSAVTKD